MKAIANITLAWKIPKEAENMDKAELFEVLKEAAAEIVDENDEIESVVLHSIEIHK